MGVQGFISELKARNVVRVAGVYAVAAWGVFSIAKTVFETLGFPQQASVVTLGLAALGLPVAIGLSWVFEKGPDGRIRRARKAQDDAPKKTLTAVDWAFLAAIALGVVLLAASAVGLAAALRGTAAGKSVAVLPFASFSTIADTEFFADGLTEEVINSLAQVEDLKVAGRTSAFYFKGRNEDLREIGRKLNVAHVVEGSVRRDGDKLRVTAQLIRVSNGYHMWSKTYDRTMDDAFAIQEEVADGVAEALKAELKAGRRGARTRRDPEAYRMELVARGQLRTKGKAQVQSAQSIFRKLIELEPENAQAHANYAYATAYLVQSHLEGDFAPVIAEVDDHVADALRLDPKSAPAHLAKGMAARVRFIREGRQSAEGEALAAFKRATELAPRDPEALSLYGDFLLSLGRPEEATPLLRRALEVDPLDRVAKNALAESLVLTDHMEEAAQQYRANIQTFPEYIDSKEQLGEVLIEQGKLDEAVHWYRLAAEPNTDPAASLMLANLYLNLGMRDEADKAMAPWSSHPIVGPLWEAVGWLSTGDFQTELAFAQKQLGMPNADPVWRDGVGIGAAMLGRNDLAREQLLITSPELFAPTPQFPLRLVNEAVGAAYVIEQTGDRAQARRILSQALAVTEPKPGRRQMNAWRMARVHAYAMMGEKERALAEFRAAIDAGHRLMFDTERFIRFDTYPTMASLRSDPRFVAMVREIEADNARMRQALLARPAKG